MDTIITRVRALSGGTVCDFSCQAGVGRATLSSPLELLGQPPFRCAAELDILPKMEIGRNAHHITNVSPQIVITDVARTALTVRVEHIDEDLIGYLRLASDCIIMSECCSRVKAGSCISIELTFRELQIFCY